MWSYYGGKGNFIRYYPPPKFDHIIETFAGSAKYAFHYYDRDVTLYDKYPVIVSIWKHLQQCSPHDIYSLPEFKIGTKISPEQFDCIEQFWLMGFLICGGGFMPNRSPTKWGIAKYAGMKNKIATGLHKIKHWKIILDSYENIPNQEATWFIDPPYQFGGHKYIHGNESIDFVKLREFALERTGQIIVCENTKADWLPFKSIRSQRGIRYTTTEALFTNYPTSYGDNQTLLQL